MDYVYYLYNNPLLYIKINGFKNTKLMHINFNKEIDLHIWQLSNTHVAC